MDWRPIVHGFIHPVDKRVNCFEPGHSEDHRLSSNRRNKKGISPGDTSNRIRQNNVGVT